MIRVDLYLSWSWKPTAMSLQQVKRLLSAVAMTKGKSPDDVILRRLKRCVKELSGPLSTVFTSCMRENKWPSQLKEVGVVPVHNKNSRSEPSN